MVPADKVEDLSKTPPPPKVRPGSGTPVSEAVSPLKIEVPDSSLGIAAAIKDNEVYQTRWPANVVRNS